jgi:hypothetical protein
LCSSFEEKICPLIPVKLTRQINKRISFFILRRLLGLLSDFYLDVVKYVYRIYHADNIQRLNIKFADFVTIHRHLSFEPYK